MDVAHRLDCNDAATTARGIALVDAHLDGHPRTDGPDPTGRPAHSIEDFNDSMPLPERRTSPVFSIGLGQDGRKHGAPPRGSGLRTRHGHDPSDRAHDDRRAAGDHGCRRSAEPARLARRRDRRPALADVRLADAAGRRDHRATIERTRPAARARATCSSTAATRTISTRRRAASALAAHRIEFADCGVSGGVWGLANGYCLMFGAMRPARDCSRRSRVGSRPRRPTGWLHCGPVGAGHFTKMIHNGIEYGMMQALAEGFALMEAKREFDLPLDAIGELWRHGSVVRSWLLDLTAEALRRPERARQRRALRRGLRRGPLDRRRSDPPGHRSAGHRNGDDEPLRFPGKGRCRQQAARADAQGVRRTRGDVVEVVAARAPEG